jgi:hypothetical protein
MKAIVKKSILACSVAAASLFAGASASAATFNPFVVDPTGPAVNAPFTADKITGNYTEVATFNSDGTFNVSLYWNAGQFVTGGGNVGLPAITTGLGFDYGVYAVYTASGVVGGSGSATTFTFLPGTGTLSLYLDDNVNTVVAAGGTPTTGTGAFTFNGTSDDILLATGNPLSGLGTLDPTLSTCGSNGINCGSFGTSSTFDLTAAGTAFFVAPNPFYSLSFQSGQLNNFSPTGTQVINGSLDVVFSNDVPEPASLGLLGLGLLGLGFARRRKQK